MPGLGGSILVVADEFPKARKGESLVYLPLSKREVKLVFTMLPLYVKEPALSGSIGSVVTSASVNTGSVLTAVSDFYTTSTAMRHRRCYHQAEVPLLCR